MWSPNTVNHDESNVIIELKDSWLLGFTWTFESFTLNPELCCCDFDYNPENIEEILVATTMDETILDALASLIKPTPASTH